MQIKGEDASLLADGKQSNLLCRDASEGDLQITAHVAARPNTDFQQAALYLYEDGDNYIAVDRGHCSVCDIGGNGVFLEYKFSGSLGSYARRTQAADLLLRLVSRANHVTGYFSSDGKGWQLVGKTESSLEHPMICLGVSNVDRERAHSADLVGKFDSVEVSRP